MIAKSGNYSWEGPAVNGKAQCVVACGAHPLDGVPMPEFTSVSGEWLILSFPVEPDEITIQCWPREDIGRTRAWGTAVEFDGTYLPMEEGDWVFQVVAKWNREDWKGEAEYHLYLSR